VANSRTGLAWDCHRPAIAHLRGQYLDKPGISIEADHRRRLLRSQHFARLASRNPAFRRVLWAVLAINAVMFAVEIGAGLAAGSAALQADALDFFGAAANYAISLFVVGMPLRYRAMAALAKGTTMGLFGLWVIATVLWHAAHGTLPSAFAMGRLPGRNIPQSATISLVSTQPPYGTLSVGAARDV
jgi:hypothetical protein